MNKKWGYTVEGLNLQESGKPGGLATSWEPLIARLSFPDLSGHAKALGRPYFSSRDRLENRSNDTEQEKSANFERQESATPGRDDGAGAAGALNVRARRAAFVAWSRSL